MQGKYEDKIKIEYAYQDINNLPEGYSVPEGRTKPWGTGHAVLSCDGIVDGTFAVINADDYYGKETFRFICNELKKNKNDNEFCMVGFKIENTLTENGHVARGVCKTNEEGCLTDIVERTKIALRGDKIMFTEDDGESWTELERGSTVSMNCWGFSGMMMTELKTVLLPSLIKMRIICSSVSISCPLLLTNCLKKAKSALRLWTPQKSGTVLHIKEDKQLVVDAIKSKIADGIYPEKLW